MASSLRRKGRTSCLPPRLNGRYGHGHAAERGRVFTWLAPVVTAPPSSECALPSDRARSAPVHARRPRVVGATTSRRRLQQRRPPPPPATRGGPPLGVCAAAAR